MVYIWNTMDTDMVWVNVVIVIVVDDDDDDLGYITCAIQSMVKC